MARAIKLINAPAGLFDIDGVLVLKTEYSTQHEDGAITPDCYIVDSGEYFWGGVDSVEERNNLMVTPIDMPTLTPPNEPLTIEELREMDGDPVWIVDVGPHKWYGPGWAIVDRDNCLVRTAKNWNPVFFEKYNELWIAFRRPPEGDADA